MTVIDDVELVELAQGRSTITVEVEWDRGTRSKQSRKVAGYAVVFDAESDPDGLPFREVIRPGAFRSTLRRNPDVLLYFGHDRNTPLARTTAGTLTLREDTRGLRFEAEIAQTSFGDDVLELVRSGHVHHCSFAFTASKAGSKLEKRDGEMWHVVSEVERLFECSLVTEPVYPQTDVSARSGAALAAIRRRLEVGERSPYGPQSEHSMFRDLAVRRAYDDATRAAQEIPSLAGRVADSVGHLLGPQARRSQEDTIQAVRERLATVEQRAVSTAAGSGQPFAPAASAPFISELFREAVHTRAVVASALRQAPLPTGGMSVQTVRLSSGASAAIIVAENAVIAELDPGTAGPSSEIATIAGKVAAAQQLLEQTAGGAFDVAIATELGRAYAESLETEVLTGPGTTHRLLGLLNQSGLTSVTYTDATPTQAEGWIKVQDLVQQFATALGLGADVVAAHPRRAAWFRSQPLASPLEWPAPVLESRAIPTNLGAGTNEDRLILGRSDDVVLLTREPRFEVLLDHAGSGTLTALCRVYGLSALLVLQPTGLGVLSGTGLAGASF